MDGGAANYIGSTPVFSFKRTIGELDRRQREDQAQAAYNQKLYQQNAALLQKQMEGVRAADIPQITQAYSAWKDAAKTIAANPKLAEMNPQKFSQLKQAQDSAEAAFWHSTANSKETAKTLNDLNEDIQRNWVRYDDNAHGTIAQTHNMTSDDIAHNGLNNADAYLYKGANYDFNKDIQAAKGKGRDVSLPTTQEGINDLTKTMKVYNDPQTAYNYLHDNATREFTKSAYAQLNKDKKDTTYAATKAAYQQLADNKDWGLRQHDIQIDDNDPFSYLTMKTMLQSKPEEGKTESKVNEGRKLAAELDNQKALEATKQRNRIALEGAKQANRKAFYDFKKANGAAEQDSILNKLIDDQYNEGADHASILTIDGVKYSGRPIHPPQDLVDKYKRINADGEFEYPSQFMITGDKRYVIPMYQTGNKKPSGAYQSTTKLKDLVPIENYKADLGKEFVSKKDWSDEMGDSYEYDDEGNIQYTPPKPQKASKKVASQGASGVKWK